MSPNTKILNERDKVLFEKGLKLYFFGRQVEVKKLADKLQERVHYTGTVAYSLIYTFVTTGSLKIEYMDFLNQELHTLLGLDSELFEALHIKPQEIDEIELPEGSSIKLFDEEQEKDMILSYWPSANKVELSDIG